MATVDYIQLITAAATLFAVMVALFGERFWRWKDRPKIRISFDEKNPEFFHQTNLNVLSQNGRIIVSIPTYYVHLKVTNFGKTTLENTEVVLEKVTPQQEKFMSLNLSWSGFLVRPNNIKRTVRIPPGQSRTVDVIEVMEPQASSKLASYLREIGDTDAERYELYSHGFRCCSIKPNTLSDVFLDGSYICHIGVYADNTKPSVFKIQIKYDGHWDKETSNMRSKHLKVKVLS